MLRNFIEKIANAKTTVMSIIGMLGTVLVSLNVVASGALTEGLAATGTIYDAIVALGLGITSLVLLFSKDDGIAV